MIRNGSTTPYRAPLLGLLMLSLLPIPLIGGYPSQQCELEIRFKTRILGIFSTGGEFTRYQCQLQLDERHPEEAQLDIIIETGSLRLDNPAWEHRAKSPDLFDVARYPTIHFHSERVEQLGERAFSISGSLTLLGTTRPVDFHIDGLKKISRSDSIRRFQAHSHLNRSAFGMDFGIPLISDRVDFRLKTWLHP